MDRFGFEIGDKVYHADHKRRVWTVADRFDGDASVAYYIESKNEFIAEVPGDKLRAVGTSPSDLTDARVIVQRCPGVPEKRWRWHLLAKRYGHERVVASGWDTQVKPETCRVSVREFLKLIGRKDIPSTTEE